MPVPAPAPAPEPALECEQGVFATRAPQRPNPICLTTCLVLAVDPPQGTVAGVEMGDESPGLDPKPPLE